MYTRSKYKTARPEETIQQVQQLLKQAGIDVKMQKINTIGDEITYRLTITNGELGRFNIGTNGKGMTEPYAIASAYGEMMERLENKFLFRENLIYATDHYLDQHAEKSWTKQIREKGYNLSFQYFPDEQEFTISQERMLNEIVPTFFPSYIGRLHLTDCTYTSIYAPYQEVESHQITLVPIEYIRAICGSNGLCAGNSREEAIIQGLNEICERYVLSHLYYEAHDLPRISLEEFKGHGVYERLKLLEKELKVIVCDCSFGIGLPVIGLLLVDQSEGTFAFKLGADFNIITALERCYTEIFQGKETRSQIFKHYHADILNNAAQFYASFLTGTGDTPNDVLHDPLKPSLFPHHDFATYEEEYDYFIHFFKNLGTHVYIRDNSFLGFPAYSIYIPGFSELDLRLFDFEKMLRLKRYKYAHLNPLLHLPKAFENEQTDEIIDLLGSIIDARLQLQKWNIAPSAQLMNQLLGTYTYAFLKDYNAAKKQLSELLDMFVGQSPIPIDLRCMYDVLSVLEEGGTMDALELLYSSERVQTILHQLNDVISYLWSLPVPHCFECQECPIKETCYMDQVIALEKTLQKQQSAWMSRT